MKQIEIECHGMRQIKATDLTDNQLVIITRVNSTFKLIDYSDNDECIVRSKLIGDSIDQFGSCKWGEAFAKIQEMFNCTSID